MVPGSSPGRPTKQRTCNVNTLFDTLLSHAPHEAIGEWLVRTGFSRYPILSALQGVEQGKDYHRQDVLPHCLETVQHVAPMSNEAVDRIAAFLHDVAKPQTKITKPDGRISFPDHAEKGAELVPDLIAAFVRDGEIPVQFLEPWTSAVQVVTGMHMRVHFLSDGLQVTDRAVRRLVTDCGTHTARVFRVCKADRLAQHQQDPAKVEALFQRAYSLKVLDESKQRKGPMTLLSGDELVEILGKAGPEVGQAKKALALAEEAGTVTTKEQAEAFIREGKHQVQPDC